MKLKWSFNELKQPMVWLHYLLGTAGIFLVFKLFMDWEILTATSSVITMILVFFGALLIFDRLIHKVLFNEDPMKELKNKILWLHYAIDSVAIVYITQWLMNQKYIDTTNILMFSIIFLAVYILVDRTSHGILELR